MMNSKRAKRPPRPSRFESQAKRPRRSDPAQQQTPSANDISAEIRTLGSSQWQAQPFGGKEEDALSPSPGTVYIYNRYICSDVQLIALVALDEQRYMHRHLWPELRRLSDSYRTQRITPNWSALQPLVFSIIALFNHRRDCHPARAADLLELFDQDVEAVSDLVHALFRFDLNPVSTDERCIRLSFLCHAFRALDHESMRQALLPLLSLPVWIHLSYQSREEQLQRFPYLRKPLSKLIRRTKQRDGVQVWKLSEGAVFALVTELEAQVAHAVCEPTDDSMAVICGATSLFSELLSQLRLRRTLLPLLRDRVTLPLLQGLTLELSRDARISTVRRWSDWLRILDLFAFYFTFPLNLVTGASMSRDDVRAERARRLLVLQRASHAICQREALPQTHSLTKLPLGSHSVIGSAEFLRATFIECDGDILHEIQASLGITTLSSVIAKCFAAERNNSKDSTRCFSPKLLASTLASYCAVQKDALESFRTAPLMVTEQDLWGPLGANEERSTEALPMLNLEFLNIQDYLLRNFSLYKWESSWAIREDIEDAIARIQPSFDSRGIKFSGWAKMAAPVSSVSVVDVGNPMLDSSAPSHVKIQIEVNVSRTPNHIRREWGSLQQHEVLFLLKLQRRPGLAQYESSNQAEVDDLDLLLSQSCVRGFVVSKPEGGVDLSSSAKEGSKNQSLVTLFGFVDQLQYHFDSRANKHEKEAPFHGFNLVVRRQAQVNNFFPVLSSLRELVLSGRYILPVWIQDVFLGRSTVQQSNRGASATVEETVDVADTFISEEHLKSSFPATKVSCRPWQSPKAQAYNIRTGYRLKVRSKGNNAEAVEATPYSLHFNGRGTGLTMQAKEEPYNRTAFNADQVEAILSGMKPGVTLIAGPPGTGKTSCIVQIASNLYHVLPQDRILIITRTNHALNDLVERLLRRDIDHLKVLRVGHGESEMSIDEPLSKAGRVDALLQRRLDLLSIVALLSRTVDATSGSDVTWSCESASLFHKDEVLPRWEGFSSEHDQSWERFPFKAFIDEIVKSTTHTETLTSKINTIPEGALQHPLQAYRLVSSIFEELESLRFLEVLRMGRQRGKYLVSSHSRIIAMTGIHAAMQRKELISQGFAYDTLIMEEAAESLEIEAFLSLIMQRTGRLKRVVLVGDHKQLPPVVQDSALQQRSNFGQSLFARLVRLGNRVVQLGQQGRSRSSIADLFRWRYPNLVDMDFIRTEPSFATANPGFLYTSQFIDTGEVSSESQPLPHFYQNVAEAEYIAFTFLYMRILGYPCDRIAVLATYNGQVQLLKEVISARSAQYGDLGLPYVVSTVDKFQGRQADYVLLSLVKTKSLGHFKDVRRVTVAVSRARYGLYMFGFLSLFSSCLEFEPVLSQLKGRYNLTLVADETFMQKQRQESDSSESYRSRMREVHSPADMAAIVSHLHEVVSK